jgi:putative type II DNA modification enzyme (methyltransferase)
MAKIHLVESNIADLMNGWLKRYKLEQESLNVEIDKVLMNFFKSKKVE